MSKIKILAILCCIILSPSTILLGQSSTQKLKVTGTVVDVDNTPLIGVSILEIGTQNGAVTDFDGNYSLEVTANSTLRFTYIGYDPIDRKITTAGVVNVTMKEDSKVLDELVVVGYGVQRKQDLTGSVSVVNMKDVEKLTAGSISEILQGQAAGVSVVSSGSPGEMGKINIRGVGSFSEVGPLYVIDGMIVNDLNNINSADIESMQVLKDASSAAIYGARGANGVIIITTKKGKSGKPTLSITGSYGVQEMAKKIKMKNTNDFLYYNQLAYLNAGVEWPANPLAESYLPNSDFQDAIFQMGKIQDYNLTYTQGSENTSVMLGGGYFSQDGVLKGPKYERYTFRVNTEGRHGIFKIGEALTLARSDHKETNTGSSSFTNALIMPPVLPIYDADEPTGRGGFGYGTTNYPTYATNPVAEQLNIDNRAVNNRIIGNVYLEVNPITGLIYKLNTGVDYWQGRRKIKDYGYTMRMGSQQTKYDNALTEIRDERMTTIMEHTLTYAFKLDKHKIDVLGGFTVQNDQYYYHGNLGYNQKVDGLWQIDLAGGTKDSEGNKWGSEADHRMYSYLGRVNYNYDDRYLLQANLRSDASSKFGPSKRVGVFPSFSFGWHLLNESFMESAKGIFDELKFRVGYGKLGDMQILPNYKYIPSMDYDGPYEGLFAILGPTNNENVNIGATQSESVNEYLQWETKTTTNIGLDFALMKNRLYGSIEWFNSKSTDLLVNLPQADATGVGSKWTNYGEMRNRGFELTLGWRDKVGGLNYNVNGNIYTVSNKVLKLGDLFRDGGWSQINRSEKGRSIGDFFLLKTDGIFQNMDEVFAHTSTLSDGTVTMIQPNAKPGDVRYVDSNQDGQIDMDDRQWMGSPIPKLQAGLNVSADYMGFDFTMFWVASFGHKIFNVQRLNLMRFDVDNSPADVTPWTWDNPSNENPRPYSSSTDNQIGQTDRFLENGSYARLKNLQFGYSLPQAWLKNLSISQCRIYLSGQNLLTITKYKGYDPEVLNTDPFGQGNDNGGYPPVRTFSAGVQVTF